MLKDKTSFSSFAVDDVARAKEFYGGTLGLEVEDMMGGLILKLRSGNVFVYPKEDYTPATFTVLNFEVDDVEAEVGALDAAGVSFERYEGFDQDDQGIARMPEGPAIAWFADPAGNILSVVSERAG
jgi:catechol 2,3-dioxygenase-like lactoylglutathione lyase family enzyme